MAARAFTAFYLKAGAIIAADAVNRPAEFMMARKLVAAGAKAGVAVLEDAVFDLKSLLSARALAG